MGEMADLAVDLMIQGGRHGRSRVYGPPLRCKGCGATDVYWQRHFDKAKRESGYRLFDIATLVLHTCPIPPNTADGFGDC